MLEFDGQSTAAGSALVRFLPTPPPSFCFNVNCTSCAFVLM